MRETVSLAEIHAALSRDWPSLCIPIAEGLGCRTGNIHAGCEMLFEQGAAVRARAENGDLGYFAIDGVAFADKLIPAWGTVAHRPATPAPSIAHSRATSPVNGGGSISPEELAAISGRGA